MCMNIVYPYWEDELYKKKQECQKIGHDFYPFIDKKNGPPDKLKYKCMYCKEVRDKI